MKINVLSVGTLGPLLLSVAHQQGFFRKFGVDVEIAPVRGARIPELTFSYSFGHIGAPAAVMLAAKGTDLRILASFDTARLCRCLVVNPEIKEPEQLRGKRLGARVTGAAMWLHTVLALQHLGLRPTRDRISIAEIGDSADIVRALEALEIDGAVLARAQCERLTRKGYSILLDLFPLNLFGAPDALAVTATFLRNHPEAAEAIVAGLIEGAAFVQSPRKRAVVLESIRSEMMITNTDGAKSGLLELSNIIARKPYPSIKRLCDMRHAMSMSNPALQEVAIEESIDDCFVRKLDEDQFIDRTYAAYGVI